MKWLRRQWWRFQLARELLEQYEYDEAHRIPFPEAMFRLNEYHRIAADNYGTGIQEWSAATRAKAEQYPSG